MGWLSNIFTSSEIVTLRQVIAELKTDIVELKDNKKELKEINLNQQEEIKNLTATIHEKELELIINSNKNNSSKSEPMQQDKKNNYDIHLTKGQKNIPNNNLKKYIWDLNNKGIELIFND